MKKIFTLISLLLVTLQLSAGPIGEIRARQIAEEFFTEYATTRSAASIELEWAGDAITELTTRSANLDNALIYIYTRGVKEGFVVVAGDDNIDPIIAYSFNTTLDSENLSEATKDIINAWSEQVSAARSGQLSYDASTRTTTRYNDELLYETALWNQGEPYNREAPMIDGKRAVTGCAATAMSIICYYNKWPVKGVGTTPAYSYTDNYDKTHTIPANTLGRTYNYDKMLIDYNNNYTNEQAKAVAALMKDMGTSTQMMYHYNESGTTDLNVAKALVDHFSYSKQSYLAYRDGYHRDEWHSLMRNNLKQYGPTFYSGQGDNGGHAFVVDGYAKNDYFHFNFGWGGYGNGYWRMPEIDYYLDQSAILCLEPDKSGTSTYRDNIMLTSLSLTNGDIMRGITSFATQYNTNEPFKVMIGGYYNIGTRTFNGDIALVHCDKYGNIKDELYNISNIEIERLYYGYVTSYITISLSEPIEEGDALRLYYKSYDSNEWQWALAYDAESDSEILICATPEQVAENLDLKYIKTTNEIQLESPYAFQFDLDNGTAQDKAKGHTTLTIPNSLLESGEHIIKISNSGSAYELKIKL